MSAELLPDGHGLDVLREAALASPRALRLLLGAWRDPAPVDRAMREGACHAAFEAPLEPGVLLEWLARGLEARPGEAGLSPPARTPSASQRRPGRGAPGAP